MTTKGLVWQRWVEPIDSFARDCGNLSPRWAVFCTYDCEPDRLERDVLPLPLLLRRGRQFRMLVLADAGSLQTRLQSGIAPGGRINI